MKELQNIIEQHPKSVALVFSRHGAGEWQLTVDNVLHLTSQKGQPFLQDLQAELLKVGIDLTKI